MQLIIGITTKFCANKPFVMQNISSVCGKYHSFIHFYFQNDEPEQQLVPQKYDNAHTDDTCNVSDEVILWTQSIISIGSFLVLNDVSVCSVGHPSTVLDWSLCNSIKYGTISNINGSLGQNIGSLNERIIQPSHFYFLLLVLYYLNSNNYHIIYFKGSG